MYIYFENGIFKTVYSKTILKYYLCRVSLKYFLKVALCCDIKTHVSFKKYLAHTPLTQTRHTQEKQVCFLEKKL